MTILGVAVSTARLEIDVHVVLVKRVRARTEHSVEGRACGRLESRPESFFNFVALAIHRREFVFWKIKSHDINSEAGAIVICPPSATRELWARRFPDPVVAFASGWMRIRARARRGGVELPLVISDHADWDELCTTVVETGCEELWVTHGAEDGLVHWATRRGLRARPLHMLGYGEAEDTDAETAA